MATILPIEYKQVSIVCKDTIHIYIKEINNECTHIKKIFHLKNTVGYTRYNHGCKASMNSGTKCWLNTKIVAKVLVYMVY